MGKVALSVRSSLVDPAGQDPALDAERLERADLLRWIS